MTAAGPANPAPRRPAGTGHLARLEAELREVAATAASRPAPALPLTAYRAYARTGKRSDYETPYFERRERLAGIAGLALLDRLGGAEITDETLGLLADEVWAVCDEWTWTPPAHAVHARDGDLRRCVDLFAAETAHTLGEIVSLLGGQLDRWDPRVTARIREEVGERVLLPFTDDPRPFRWESYENNWLAVCGGSVGMTALALLADDPERLRRALDRALAATDRFLGSFGDDGGCIEGITYWAYGFGYFVYFAEALRDHGGPDLLEPSKVAELAAFPARLGFGGGRYPAFADANERAWLPTGLVSRLVRRLGAPVPVLPAVPAFRRSLGRRWGHLSRDILWTDPALLGRPAEASSAFFADLGWAVDRRDAAEVSATLAFAARAGHNAEPHNHLDLGHFVVHVGGESLLTDLGAGPYTRDYFDDAVRYTLVHPSAEAHSVPVVDGCTQVPGRPRQGVVTESQPTGDGIEFAVDLTAAYEVDGLNSLTRSFSWRRSGTLTLVDEVDCSRAMAFDELFVSRRRPEVSADAVVWRGASGSLRLDRGGLDRGGLGRLEPEVEVIEAEDHDGRPDIAYRLRLRGGVKAGVSRLVFRFTASLLRDQNAT